MATDDPFDPDSWQQKTFTERTRVAAHDWVQGGINIPLAGYVFCFAKVVLFVLGWMFFASFTTGLGSFSGFTIWIFHPVAFKKAWLWGGLVEVLGLSCGSGPLNGRFWPPFTVPFHLLRPGTIKLAPFPKLRFFGGTRRSILDVVIYVALLASLLNALVAPDVGALEVAPILTCLALCALTDKTIPLCARYEHHFAMILCFAFPGSWLAGAKWVQLSIWFWAGVSKLTRAFAYVVPMMIANNPMLGSPSLRHRLFRAYPDDLDPSGLSRAMAAGGTFLELAAPLTLIWVTGDGPLLYVGLFWALALHGFIISNMPAGAVFEWNVLSIYTTFFLFFGNPTASIFAIDSPLLVSMLVINSLLLPFAGQFLVERISFLVSMRYYAGNWPWNAWFFRGESRHKLDRLKRVAPLASDAVAKLLSPREGVRFGGAYLAFRTMHLQGRILGKLLPTILGGADFRNYTYVEGEMVSASALGWSFGEGHSSNQRLLGILQEECAFEEGEVRLLSVESQPLLGSSLAYRIYDAKTGLIDRGAVSLDELAKRKPWEEG